MQRCFVCDKYVGNIETAGVTIYEDQFDRNGRPNDLGPIMIDLKRYVTSIAEMTSNGAKAFRVMMARASKARKESEWAESIYSIVFGKSVPHLHLVAGYPNTPKEFGGPMEVYDWEEALMGRNQAVIERCSRIAIYLEDQLYEQE